MLIIQTDAPRTEHKETYLRLVAVWNRACAQTGGTYITGKMRARQWCVVEYNNDNASNNDECPRGKYARKKIDAIILSALSRPPPLPMINRRIHESSYRPRDIIKHSLRIERYIFFF